MGKYDFKAARVIEKVIELYGGEENLSVNDLIETLMAALWWAQFALCVEQKNTDSEREESDT
ncbi:MAG: hypothetical protein HZB51_34340 [Chloroflexi bacterium]|nr:hypothetical protein [Chloroflexota bacterium]